MAVVAIIFALMIGLLLGFVGTAGLVAIIAYSNGKYDQFVDAIVYDD